MPDYDKIHSDNIKRYERQVKQAYLSTIDAVVKIAQPLSLNKNSEFYFRNYSDINNKVNDLILELNSNVKGITISGVQTEWETANEKNDAITRAIFGKKLEDIPADIRAKYLSNNYAARQAFIYRKEGGLNLSDRVWRNTRQLKTELELALEVGIGKGRSAAALSQDVRKYLNNPDMLFRRVRDDNGVLRLSKASKAYNPGRGIYRSSYKNALRLTRNETNFAYEASQKEKRKDLDFIVGIEIKVSPGHNPADDKNGISCLSLQGKYEKDFDFTQKWHVNCKCLSFNVLKTDKELDEDLYSMAKGGNPSPSNKSKNAVNELPKGFTNYVNNNKELWSNWGRQPYWLDNIK